MSGIVTDYYATKAKAQTNFIIFSIFIIVALIPIYLGMHIRELIRQCSNRSPSCNKMEILGYSVAFIYLIIVAIMQIQKYRKGKAFDVHIEEKKKTNDELKVIDDENKAFSKKVHIISIPLYIILAIIAIFIVISLAQGQG